MKHENTRSAHIVSLIGCPVYQVVRILLATEHCLTEYTAECLSSW
jgi:hypothetical protein